MIRDLSGHIDEALRTDRETLESRAALVQVILSRSWAYRLPPLPESARAALWDVVHDAGAFFADLDPTPRLSLLRAIAAAIAVRHEPPITSSEVVAIGRQTVERLLAFVVFAGEMPVWFGPVLKSTRPAGGVAADERAEADARARAAAAAKAKERRRAATARARAARKKQRRK